MTFDCKDLARALALPDLLPEAREHAKVCDACRRELWLWSEMSSVAPGLREEWDTPDLWPKIRETLHAHQRAAKPRRYDWRLLGAVAALLIAGVAIFIVTRSPFAATPVAKQDGEFLTDQTLKEVERTEAAYRASIDKLARLAQTKLSDGENTAALAGREKLLVLDSEISEVRSTVDHNRFNARLQTELAVLYREKQDTLKEILQSAQKF